MHANLRSAVLLALTSLAWTGCASHGGAPVGPAAVEAHRPAGADVLVRRGHGGYVVDARPQIVVVTFMNLNANRCNIGRSCYYFSIVMPGATTTARAPSACDVRGGLPRNGTRVECPAIGNVVFQMMGGGTWYGYLGNGKHSQGPCSTHSVTIYTSSAEKAQTTVEAWDECPETIVCVKAKGAKATVQADKFDVIRGKCASVVRA